MHVKSAVCFLYIDIVTFLHIQNTKASSKNAEIMHLTFLFFFFNLYLLSLHPSDGWCWIFRPEDGAGRCAAAFISLDPLHVSPPGPPCLLLLSPPFPSSLTWMRRAQHEGGSGKKKKEREEAHLFFYWGSCAAFAVPSSWFSVLIYSAHLSPRRLLVFLLGWIIFILPVFFQGHRQIGNFFGPWFARVNVLGELSLPKLWFLSHIITAVQ